MIHQEQAKQKLIDKGKELLENYSFESLIDKAVEKLDNYVEITIQSNEEDVLISTLRVSGYTWDYNRHTLTLTIYF